MSHVKTVKTIQMVTRAKVIKLLGITEMEYNEYQMQQGYAYLESQLGESIMGRSLSGSAMFWAWWRNHWHGVELDFVDMLRTLRFDMADRTSYYKMLHDVERVCNTPHKSVMQDAFKNIENDKPLIKHIL